MRALLLTALIALAGPALSEGERAGDLDYYVLSLSWSPTWCALTGTARGAEQCDEEADFGWVLHGLWPQFERGWPSYCTNAPSDPSRRQTAAMADIMGDGGAAWYQWKKHGRCSGLASEDYFGAARTAFEALEKPRVLRDLDKSVRLPASVIEDAFIQSNPAIERDMLTVTCKAKRIQEVRLCLTRDLAPRRCGADVIRDCSLRDALFDPID
ncbi:Ribonuclease [Profundibacterium mesophilum KAUST100406-0324]|uniref:Ribonuclease n=2 Tax=Profundibacterium TaxID=1258570 RepID=A0A921NPY4_9RHOB|nr:Ribonuclease [Profundibacterium mesophilum KAUST100406-0324]